MRRRSLSVTSSGSDGARLSVTAALPAAGAGGLDGVPADRIDVGRRRIEADRPRDVEHVVDEAVQPLDLLVDVLGGVADVGGARAVAVQRAQRALDDHQRVAHFVRDHGRQPAQRRQPLALRGLALKADDRIGQRIERRRQHVRVVVVPAALALGGDLAGQVAGRGDVRACDR